ncbi:MAG TPA: hypothetical protein PLM93_10450 [Sulfuricurvum sp.]|nr:MAG: hypothetical protein B7Y30_07810 [Campylobacterales bacterium 16-40-21]OZA02415.1 MAG: hypothetical protein B7X89_09275 [Sulfuricurvum sp. 17-40-25]HQS67589.1 hypothetical protein [Sulfuricurvum sp.]HQT36696.1 hypothetical protein [Sulfuricurvum sp.]
MKKILLVLLFAFSLFAEESEEIGVPKFDRDQGVVDSAVLAPDGKSFYTLKDNYFIHWSLSPLKKLEQWELSLAPLESMKNVKNVKNHRDVYLLNDETKVLIISRDELVLYDLKSKQIEKQLPYKNLSHSLDNNLLYIVYVPDQQERSPQKTPYSPSLYLDTWKVPELTKVKSTNLTKQSENLDAHLKHHEDYGPYEVLRTSPRGELVMGGSVIYYVTAADQFAIIDKSSLNLKDVLATSGIEYMDDYLIVYQHALGTCAIKKDDGSVFYKASAIENKEDIVISALLDRIEGFPPYIIPRREPMKQRRSSYSGDLALRFSELGRLYTLYRKNQNKYAGTAVLQYRNELILRQNSKFEYSGKDFKDLKMINKDGVVPMNKATFEKYNQPLNIKAN